MENLNAEAVKKALECCVKAETHLDCIKLKCPALINDECIYIGETDEDCDRQQLADALALINSQEQRIGELEKYNADMKVCGFSAKELAEKCERLTEENENLHATCTKLTQELHEVQKRGSFTLTVNFDEEQVKKIKSECLACIDLDIKTIEADIVREIFARVKERLPQLLSDSSYLNVLNEERWLPAADQLFEGIAQIAKEMLEGV